MAIAEDELTTADAWIGSEIQDRDEWQYQLSAEDIAELRAALNAAKATGLPVDAWTTDDFPLPTLNRRIADWMRTLNEGRGFILVKGFPVAEHSKDDCGLIYRGMGLYMGVAVSQNVDGDLLGHVRDVGADPDERGVRLYKTRAEQDFHVDGADIIGLFCLRNGKRGGVSRIVSSVSIYNEIARLRPDLLSTLYQTFPFDRQGQEKAGENPWFEFPICHFDEGRLRTFFIPWYIKESQQHASAPRLSEHQRDCIELIQSIANDPRLYLDIDFERGDMQFLKNAAVLHKRTAYEDWDEPKRKRHLLRLWLTSHDFSSGNEMLRKGIAP